ncbi:hypothetical protein QEN19_004183 [Hanseniaspora menglaensis]
MVDFACYKFASKVSEIAISFNHKYASKKISLEVGLTSDELQHLPKKEADTKVQPFLKFLIENLADFYIEFGEKMYNIPPSKHGWEQSKVDEMIDTTGLHYVSIFLSGEMVGFISFLMTEESITGASGKRILYLMEIHLNKKQTGHGIGGYIIQDYLLKLCNKLKMDLEFVCFKKNNIGNSFYEKMAIRKLAEEENQQLEFWFSFLNVYRMDYKSISKKV